MTLEQTLQAAIAHHQAGRLAQAEPLYRQVLAQRPEHPTALHLLGVIAGQVGRLDVAQNLIRQAIAINPGEPYYYLNLAKYLSEEGKTAEAIDALRQAVALAPTFADAHSHLGSALRLQGFFQESLAAHREAYRLRPDSPDILLNLGNALHSAGQKDEGIAMFRQAVALNPRHPAALNNLGAALKLKGRLEDAMGLFRQALALQPQTAEVWDNIGGVFYLQGNYADAIDAYRKAITINPRYAEAYNNLGTSLTDSGKLEEALAAYQQALSLKPEFAEAHNNFGIVTLRLGRLDESVKSFERALQIRRDYVDAHCNVGNAYKDRADLPAAKRAFRRALELEPTASDAHSNLLFTLHFDPETSPREILAEARRWNERHASPLASKIRPHQVDRTPDRPLRIGFVSPDFREHCQSLFTIPLFSRLDRQKFLIHAYADVAMPDDVTRRIQGHVATWRPIFGLSHDAVADMIRADGIDILVDLTMHMAHNRLKVFAQKPAPVQVSWLAYPGTTGLDTIDYRLTDPHLDPPETDLSVYSERTLHLPDTFWCYDPLMTDLPVSHLPARQNGSITFGSLNNFCKVNDAVLDLWGRTMAAVPGSRLILLTNHGSHRQWVMERLARHGIDPNRIEMIARLSRADYLRQYHRVDIGLDTFPYNGHTTSLDALWMGVPVITYCPPGLPPGGATVVGRAGLSQWRNLGQPEMVTPTTDGFVETVVGLAGDLDRLEALRAGLRGRMEQSALMDAHRFAANFGGLCRQTWKRYLEGGQ